MDSRYSVVSGVVGVFVVVVGLAVFGWSTLPEHHAAAARTEALTPYLQQQEAIRTDELYGEAVRRAERAAAVQPYKTGAQIGFYVMLMMAMMVGSGFVANATRRRGERLTKQMQLPVLQETGNYLVMGDGQRTFVIDRLTGQMNAAFTKLDGNDGRAQIMEKLLITQALAAGAAAVAKETKDPAMADYLMTQMENITNAVNEPTNDRTKNSAIYEERNSGSAIIQDDSEGNGRSG